MSNMLLLAINLPLFLLTQAVSAVCSKWSVNEPSRYWWGVVILNVLNVVATPLLINIYKSLPGSIAQALCAGSAFLACQLALFLAFRQPISPIGWVAIGFIFTGVVMFAFAK